MKRDEIFQKVKKAVAESMEVDINSLLPDTTLDSLSADSLDKIELVVALEEEFNTSVDDDVLTNIKTLNDCVDVVESAVK